MFLPSQLPKGARRRESLEEQQPGTEEMGGKGKKKAADRDEMLGPNSPMAVHRPSTSAGPAPGFVARSWARISGRRRRQKRRMAAEAAFERREQRFSTTLTTADAQPYGNGQTGQARLSWPTLPAGNSGAGNLAALAHLEEDMEGRRKRHFIGRGMDRIRRSIRRSLHKGSQSGQALTHSAQDGQPGSSSAGTNVSSVSKAYCHSDEIAVRSAACSFPVKYLGACEVFESRGMNVCESALQHLRTRKRTIKALLYVSGDGIRVVDQENNRGLIVDQTIEKVSFCSPDRHNDKGFAYICRDGATRRWMCHGFHAIKDSGERLSHAVGCAFTVCLEKKRKRDAETTAYKNAQSLANSLNDQQQIPLGQNQEYHNDAFSRTNQGYRSFRQLSISERRADPQKAILVEQPRPISLVESPAGAAPTTAILAAKPRPSANPTLFERTGSLRAPANNPPPIPGPKPSLNRFNSLQHGTANRNSLPKISLYNEPIWEGDDDGQEEKPSIGNGGYPLATGSHENNFYRTLPYSLPNFGQSISQWSPSSVIQPTILEEAKQNIDRPLDLDNSSPPADPFISTTESGPKARAEGWLEQTFQRAASISSAMPRSATMNLPPQQHQHQNWAQFPQSQSFAQEWTDGISDCAKTSCPPAQPPPPLPLWVTSPGSFSTIQSSSSESMPISILPTPKLRKPVSCQNHPEETDQQQAMANKNHLRKASGNRRIEYQLLQETDVSLSPPKSDSSMPNRMAGGGSQRTVAEDPFDVHWSQRVLEETAKQRQNGGNQLKVDTETKSSGQQANPFTWEMGSASVNV